MDMLKVIKAAGNHSYQAKFKTIRSDLSKFLMTVWHKSYEDRARELKKKEYDAKSILKLAKEENRIAQGQRLDRSEAHHIDDNSAGNGNKRRRRNRHNQAPTGRAPAGSNASNGQGNTDNGAQEVHWADSLDAAM